MNDTNSLKSAYQKKVEVKHKKLITEYRELISQDGVPKMVIYEKLAKKYGFSHTQSVRRIIAKSLI